MKKMLPLVLTVAGVHAAELERMIARFAPTELRVDTSAISEGDRKALGKLIEASRVIDDIFLTQLWSGNHELLHKLERDKSPAGKQLFQYFGLNKGPLPEL